MLENLAGLASILIEYGRIDQAVLLLGMVEAHGLEMLGPIAQVEFRPRPGRSARTVARGGIPLCVERRQDDDAGPGIGKLWESEGLTPPVHFESKGAFHPKGILRKRPPPFTNRWNPLSQALRSWIDQYHYPGFSVIVHHPDG